MHTTTMPEQNTTPALQNHTALDIINVHKAYTSRKKTIHALNGATLKLPCDQWAALLGPNGSGKSTLMRLICNLDVPDSGSIKRFDLPLNTHSQNARAMLGVVFQNPGLDPLLTVSENLITQAALFGLTGDQARNRIKSITQIMRIDDRLDQRVGTLSGGLIRRADLARAVLHKPQLLLLDEPTTGLDHESRTAFINLIHEIRTQAAQDGKPIAVLMSTHLMDEAAHADAVVLMHEGKVAAAGTPDQLINSVKGRTLTTETAARELFDSMNVPFTSNNSTLSVNIESIDIQMLEKLAASLAKQGADFAIARPTLADAYLSFTGQMLADNNHTEPPSHAHRARKNKP